MREKILEKAEEQLKHGGYEALNFAHIAKDLGTTRANLHYHFKNKETLAKETTKHYAETHIGFIKEIALAYKGDFIGMINKLEDLFWELSEIGGSCGICVCSQLSRDQETPDSLKKMAAGHTQEIQDIFFQAAKDGIESGQLGKRMGPQDIALQTGFMMNGLMSMGQSYSSVGDAKKNLKGVVARWAELYRA